METSTTEATATYQLGGAVSGFQGFVAGIGDNNTCWYCAMAVDANGVPNGGWEVGIGTVDDASPDTLTRDKIVASSNANAAVSWAAGTRRIFVTASAAQAVPALDAGGRLSGKSAVSLCPDDLTAIGTIYYVPHRHSEIGLWNGNGWQRVRFVNPSLAVSISTGQVKDVFGALSSGALALEFSAAWRNTGQAVTGASNATPIVITANAHGLSNGDQVIVSGVLGNTAANGEWTVANVAANTFEMSGSVGNGAYTSGGWFAGRVDALADQDGVRVKSSDKTRRHLGTIRGSGTNTTEDSGGGTTTQVGGKRFVWNRANHVPRYLAVIDTTNTWSYTTDTIRQANGATGNKVECVCGDAATDVYAEALGVVFLDANNTTAAKVGVGIDSTTTFSGHVQGGFSSGPVYSPVAGHYSGYPGLGSHFFSWNEKGADGTSTFIGADGSQQTGLRATVQM